MADQATYFKNIADLQDQIPEDSILSRTFHQIGGFKAILFGFAAGQQLSEHTASVPAVIQILEGEADLILGEDHQEGTAGTWAYMPAELPHSITARTPVTMLLYLLPG